MPTLRSGRTVGDEQPRTVREREFSEEMGSLSLRSGSGSRGSRGSRLEAARRRHELERRQEEMEEEVRRLQKATDEARRKAEEARCEMLDEEEEQLSRREGCSVGGSERSRRTRDWVSKSSQDFVSLPQNQEPFIGTKGRKMSTRPPCSLISPTKGVGTKDQTSHINVAGDELKGWVARKHVAEELPNFDGDPTQWPLFINMFHRSTTTGKYTEEENLLRLRRALKGEAKECVGALLLLPGGLNRVMERLKRRYGNPDMIVKKVMSRLEGISAMGEGLVGLEKIASEMENLVSTVVLLQRNEYLFNPVILDMMVGKLNVYLRLQWGERAVALGEGPIGLDQFSDWLQGKADTVMKVGEGEVKIQSTTEKKNLEPTRRHCLCCNLMQHDLEDCRKFTKMPGEERMKWVRERGVCFVCLRRGHRGVHCRSKITCKVCNNRHHALLHPKTHSVATHQAEENLEEGKNSAELEEDADVETTAVNIKAEGRILLCILPVLLRGPIKTIQTYAFLDNGSSVSMIDEKVAKELGLSGPVKPLRVSWSDRTVREEDQSCEITVPICGTQQEAKQFLLKARTVKHLALPSQSIDRHSLGLECPKLAELEISSFKDAKPTVLIGEDNWPLSVPLKVVHGAWDGPVATKTRLGWVVHGRAPVRIKGRVKEEETEEHQMSHWEEDPLEREKSLLRQVLSEYMAKEGVGGEEEAPDEDAQAVATFNKTTRRVGDRWETGLLWKNENPLPHSYATALRRLLSLERKMDRDPEYGRRYVAKMEEGMEKGYLSKLEKWEEREKPGREWFLPHLGVINPNKPGKLRICFDASAKSEGVSLNDMLLTGPDLLVSIPGLLCRFREHPVAVSGDIREMYPQIKIRHEDQMAQKFLWRAMERGKPPQVYVVRVMTFGAKCSPFSAQEVKNRNGREFEGADPATVQAILKNHYMDDYLDSCEDEETACHRVQEVCKVHKSGGFIMCNWVSNSNTVLDSVPPDLRSPKDSLEVGDAEKLLGMWWCPKSDDFQYKVKLERIPEEVRMGNRRPTKREILKCVMALYDPLGLIIVWVMEGKILLQEVWKSNIDWDEPIGEVLGRDWDSWMKRLSEIETLRIPRCYEKDHVQEIELHVMCDASEKAYAAVAYVRIRGSGGVRVQLASAKARVTQVNSKAITIPKLELQAAVMAARVAKLLKEEHRFEFARVIFWTDSQIVLSWIRHQGRQKLQVYVQRRVSEILGVSTPDCWRWVPTKENCADYATRNKPKMGWEERWFQGPPFLLLEEEQWPQENKEEQHEEESAFVGLTQEKEWELLPDVSRFSQWNRLVRVTAKIARFGRYWRYKRDADLRELTAEEIDEADRRWIRKAQADSFAEEIDAIQSKKALPLGSRLKALDPFICEDGFLRAGGRLEAAVEISYDARFPLILAPEHNYTRMVLMKYHKWVKHQGQETMHNMIRQRFWVTSARKAVKSTFNRCGLCKLKRVKAETPKMAPLPRARVTHGLRPFVRTGLDYFGPVRITVGRRTEKRYVALFTCLAVRAVHLEIAADLSSSTTIMAIRRFAARRGMPAEIYSDNGTNFRKADKELKDALNEMNQEEVLRQLALVGIRWKFNCPAAPHMGGAWERMVRTVKVALDASLQDEHPREDVLATMLAEVEMIVNNRPLTHVSVDHRDLTCLTPSHFLIGEANAGPMCRQLWPAENFRQMWRRSQQLADKFWRRWARDYQTTLVQCNKWTTPVGPLKIGDLVVTTEEGYGRGRWHRGVVSAVDICADGQVRTAQIKTAQGLFRRPATKLAKLTLET